MQTKKLLGSTLALGMLFPAQSFAAESLLKGLKLGGQIDIQSTAARNTLDFATRGTPGGAANNDRIGDVQTRVLVTADWDLLDDVHGKVTLRKNDRTWGTNGGSVQAPATNSQTVGTAGANILGSVFVDQANVKIDKVAGAVDLTAGRQFYGTSGDMVIYFGPSDKAQYGLPSTAIDAFRADWAGSWGGLTALAGKITGNAVGALVNNDVNVFGLNAAIKGTDMVSGGAYIYNATTHGNGALGTPTSATGLNGQNDVLWVVGAKAKAQMGMGWLAAEVAKNFGQNRGNAAPILPSRNYSGWAAKVDAGAKVETPFGGVAPWGHFGYGTGDSNSRSASNHGFTAINGDYRPGGIYGRFSSNNFFTNPGLLGKSVPVAGQTNPVGGNGTLTNRVIWGLGVKTTPSALNKLTAGVSYWDYRSQTSGNPVNGLPVVGGAPSPFSGNKHIGSEADLDLAWQHSENVTLGAGAGQFWPGGMIMEWNKLTAGTPTNPATLAYFDVRVKF